MKKRLMGLFLGLSVMAMATPQGNEALKSSVNLQVNATVIAKLDIAQVASMEFGELIAGAVNAHETQKGQVKVTGQKNDNIIITVPETATISNGKESMTVAMTKTQAGENKMTLNEAGVVTKDLSGTIATVETATGNYTGTVTITARYE